MPSWIVCVDPLISGKEVLKGVGDTNLQAATLIKGHCNVVVGNPDDYSAADKLLKAFPGRVTVIETGTYEPTDEEWEESGVAERIMQETGAENLVSSGSGLHYA